ncbi:MAG: hypothetical protein FWG00_02940 [Coriobacteriia bacterium]|nr:hypothetical protein [Coriobacteriia bacterium]
MNKLKYVALLSLIIVLVLGVCCKPVENENGSASNVEKFEKLKLGTSIDDVYQELGEPTDDIGSGVPILIYEMKNDKTNELEVFMLNFDLGNSLTKVTLLGKDGDNRILVGE